MDINKLCEEIHPPLDLVQARREANRCFYCYDAPCIKACPTQIDIPTFIQKIATGNTKGAALTILQSNILGGTCARVCPVETLCQHACVRNTSEKKPVEIGRLQRFAVDALDEMPRDGHKPFERARPNGKSVGVIGAGPAGLSCAHQLARLGFDVTIYEARTKAGGLNEYGLAPYKVTSEFVRKEIEFVLSIGGIKIEYGMQLGKSLTLDTLRKKHAAVFIGTGLGTQNKLGIEGENLNNIEDATLFIAKLREAITSKTSVKVGENILVIGGGNTAIDVAIESKRLGARCVAIIYRRGEENIGATRYERELARSHGIEIKTWLRPVQFIGAEGKVREARFERTRPDSSGRVVGADEFITLTTDQVFKAVGQKMAENMFAGSKEIPEISAGKIQVNEQFATTVPLVCAGGDCVRLGEDLTVTAVEHGKRAALAIASKLEGSKNG